MEHRPYTLLNTTELSVIRRRVENAYHAWSGAWMMGTGEFTARCHRAAEFDLSALDEKACWARMECGPGKWIAIGCGPAFDARLGCTLIPPAQTGGVSGKASPLLADLADVALADFLRLVGDATSLNAQSHDAEMPGAQTWEAGSGAVVVDIAWAGENAAMVISPELVASVLDDAPAPSARKAHLTRPGDALANGRVKLNVLVGEAQLEFALLQTIVVGDVIKLDTRIDEPLQVVNDDGVRFCGAFLGCTEGQKAIRLAK